MHISLWNNKYIIASDYNNKSFKIIDLEIYKVITEIKHIENFEIKSVKKVYHPIFGESLLSCDKKGNIKLWII